jgi:hypothetical protein
MGGAGWEMGEMKHLTEKMEPDGHIFRQRQRGDLSQDEDPEEEPEAQSFLELDKYRKRARRIVIGIALNRLGHVGHTKKRESFRFLGVSSDSRLASM